MLELELLSSLTAGGWGWIGCPRGLRVIQRPGTATSSVADRPDEVIVSLPFVIMIPV
ncbi:MAG: hypothetical protein ACYTHJ_16725 [Planctomycetota bacterium]|jgi:hypothetical protein